MSVAGQPFSLLLNLCLFLYVLSEIRGLFVADYQETIPCVRFDSDLGKLYLELMQRSKQLLIKMPWGKQTLFSSLRKSNRGENLV